MVTGLLLLFCCPGNKRGILIPQMLNVKKYSEKTAQNMVVYALKTQNKY